MDINLTLLGQILTFMLFVWVTMKWIWPPINQAILERQKQISDGLEAARKGQEALEAAQRESVALIGSAKEQAVQLLNEAKARGERAIEEASEKARQEADRLLEEAKVEIERQTLLARSTLRQEAVEIAVDMTQKLVEKIGPGDLKKWLDDVIAEC